MPVNFAAPAVELSGDAGLAAAFRNEHSALATWFDRALETTGRTSTGVAGMDPERVRDMFCELLTAGFAVLPSVGREAADLGATRSRRPEGLLLRGGRRSAQ